MKLVSSVIPYSREWFEELQNTELKEIVVMLQKHNARDLSDIKRELVDFFSNFYNELPFSIDKVIDEFKKKTHYEKRIPTLIKYKDDKLLLRWDLMKVLLKKDFLKDYNSTFNNKLNIHKTLLQNVNLIHQRSLDTFVKLLGNSFMLTEHFINHPILSYGDQDANFFCLIDKTLRLEYLDYDSFTLCNGNEAVLTKLRYTIAISNTKRPLNDLSESKKIALIPIFQRELNKQRSHKFGNNDGIPVMTELIKFYKYYRKIFKALKKKRISGANKTTSEDLLSKIDELNSKITANINNKTNEKLFHNIIEIIKELNKAVLNSKDEIIFQQKNLENNIIAHISDPKNKQTILKISADLNELKETIKTINEGSMLNIVSSLEEITQNILLQANEIQKTNSITKDIEELNDKKYKDIEQKLLLLTDDLGKIIITTKKEEKDDSMVFAIYGIGSKLETNKTKFKNVFCGLKKLFIQKNRTKDLESLYNPKHTDFPFIDWNGSLKDLLMVFKFLEKRKIITSNKVNIIIKKRFTIKGELILETASKLAEWKSERILEKTSIYTELNDIIPEKKDDKVESKIQVVL
jgi:hypothetical protein